MIPPKAQRSKNCSKSHGIDPLSYAIPVCNPAIKENLDLDSGKIIETTQFINEKRYDELIQARSTIKERLLHQPLFSCAICGTHVYLISNKFKRFFFRHKHEDGSCPAKTRGKLNQEEIRARKYRGLRESKAHQKIKELIARSLQADSEFSEVYCERRLTSAENPERYRRPDVQATLLNRKIAFEAQLSTTFLDVVCERKDFYRQEGVLLVWIICRFEPKRRRLTQDDLLFTNNSNIFVVDEETAKRSEETGQFQLRCHYRVPIRRGDDLEDRWQMKIVPFNELTCERDQQRAWYFDYESAVSQIRAEIAKDQQKLLDEADETLRQQFIEFWKESNGYIGQDEAVQNKWEHLHKQFAARNINLPTPNRMNSNFYALWYGVIGAYAGKPIGWKYKKLVEVGHKIAESYPQHIVAFGYAVKIFDVAKLLEDQDQTGKWKKRTKEIADALAEGRRKYLPDTEHLPLVKFVFPIIAKKIQKTLDKTTKKK